MKQPWEKSMDELYPGDTLRRKREQDMRRIQEREEKVVTMPARRRRTDRRAA